MTNKITKKDNFMAIVEVLRENGKEELAKVMEHEIELLSAKAGKKSEKVVAEQASVDNMVLNALTTEAVTATEIYKRMGTPDGITIPKITASLGRLVRAGKATNVKNNKTSLYGLPTETVEE